MFMLKPSKRATLSDPDGATLDHPISPKVMLPSAIGKTSATAFSKLRGSITSTLRLAARFSHYLRLTHVVTSISPRLVTEYGGFRFPMGTFTPIINTPHGAPLTLHKFFRKQWSVFTWGEVEALFVGVFVDLFVHLSRAHLHLPNPSPCGQALSPTHFRQH